MLLRPWLLSCLKLRVADKEEQALGFIFLFARELSDSILQQPLELLCGLDVLFFFWAGRKTQGSDSLINLP